MLVMVKISDLMLNVGEYSGRSREEKSKDQVHIFKDHAGFCVNRLQGARVEAEPY